MRGRGLKQGYSFFVLILALSPLMRGRGLKHFIGMGDYKDNHVAPHAGAWIETERSTNIAQWGISPLMRGGGFKL